MTHQVSSTAQRGQQVGTALVTGAGQRIGRAIALALARSGWRIAVHFGKSREAALQTVDDIQTLGGEAQAFTCDLADEAAVNQLIDTVNERFGPVTALVNNAGRFEYDDATTFSGKRLLEHLGPNLVAPIVLARNLAAHVKAQGPQQRGVVINLLDQKLWNYNPDFLSYTLTKAAMEAANTMLAQSLAPAVRVVGVAPGLTLPSHMQSAEAFAHTHAMAPLGQASNPEDIASAVVFAASNPAITGTTIIVDGGQHLMGFGRDFSMMQP